MDSGIELNEPDTSSSVVHRTPTHSKNSENDDSEPEILDQDQQQQVIDNLTRDYEHMIKTQRYSFIVLTLIISLACLFASYSTGSYKILLPASAAYFSLLLAQFLLQASKKRSKSPPIQKENEKTEEKNDSSISQPSNKTNTLWIWVITSVFEGYSLYSSLKYGSQDDSIKRTPIIMLHVGYLILAAFLISSQRFSQSFPEEIQNLQKLKYGSKLA